MRKTTKEMIDFFQAIFTSKIHNVTAINPGIDSTNDVFLIDTNSGPYILKVLKDIYSNCSVFWRGMSYLFDARYEVTYRNLRNLSDYLNKLEVIKVPKIIKTEASFQNPIHKPYMII